MRKNTILTVIIIVVFSLAIFLTYQFITLRKAHSTFENYYTFRECTQLLNRTNDYGICKTKSGQAIKIVKYHNKWYLDGDLPWGCVGSVCFGL